MICAAAPITYNKAAWLDLGFQVSELSRLHGGATLVIFSENETHWKSRSRSELFGPCNIDSTPQWLSYPANPMGLISDRLWSMTGRKVTPQRVCLHLQALTRGAQDFSDSSSS